MRCKFKGCNAVLVTPKGFQRHMMDHVERYREIDQFLERFDRIIAEARKRQLATNNK